MAAPTPPTSEAILLLNFESPFRERLALTLRACRFRVLVPEEHGKSLAEIKDEYLQQADYMICDLTRVNHDIWSELRRICRWRKRDGLPVLAGCWSRVYRGPEFELLTEKQLGARLVYAK